MTTLVTKKTKSMQTTLIGKILTFRKNHTLRETGKKFNITGERVRQIQISNLKSKKLCYIHNKYYFNKCLFCLNFKNYSQEMNKLDYSHILLEVSRQANNKKRDYVSVQRRIYLIKRLHEQHNQSFSEIARLLKKHHSTISYLYHRNK